MPCKKAPAFSENCLNDMYYHQIDFPTQALFFIYSFAAGIVDGCFALILCSGAIKRTRIKIISDIAFCLISVLIIVCTNIVLQDAALRIYEVIAFLAAFILFLLIFKRKSDKVSEKAYAIIKKRIITPIYTLCKHIINISKKILKKIHEVVYNFIHKCKELLKRHGGKEKSKKEKDKTGQTAA